MQDLLGRDSDLFWLVYFGNFEKVKEYFEKDPNATVHAVAHKQSGHTVLEFAAYNGVAVDDPTDPNDPIQVEAKRVELLEKRIALGKVVEFLLLKGADPLYQDEMDRYALHLAFNSSNPYIVAPLLYSHAGVPDLDSYDEQRRTVFHALCCSAQDTASKVRGADFVTSQRLLLNAYKAAGKDPKQALTKTDIFGLTPPMLAKFYGYDEVLQELLSQGLIDSIAAIPVISKNHPGVKYDYLGRDDLLANAFVNRHADVAAAMVQGAHPMFPNKQAGYRLPLHLACCGISDGRMVRLLLTHPEINPVATDMDGDLPLHFATNAGRTDTVEALLENAQVVAHINDQDDKGWTALHTLTMAGSRPKGRATLITTLLEAGLDYKLVDSNGRTALDLADERGNKVVADALRAAIETFEAKITAVAAAQAAQAAVANPFPQLGLAQAQANTNAENDTGLAATLLSGLGLGGAAPTPPPPTAQ